MLAAFTMPATARGLGESVKPSAAQDIRALYKSNNCVTCHAQIMRKIMRAMLSEAKVRRPPSTWRRHAFNLEVARRKADAAFETGTELKDELRSKFYPQH